MPYSSIQRKVAVYTWWIVSLWTVIIVGLTWWDIATIREFTRAKAIGEARANFQKDLIFRDWATSHGGVYVPIDESTPSNQYLEIVDRDITTPSGVRLTLMNPAYMMRQINDIYNKAGMGYIHLTSLKLLNPNNKPDPWEEAALKSFELGKTEAMGEMDIGGAPHMRIMRPIKVVQGCLKCHASFGYKVGDIRGGISVAVAMDGHYRRQRHDIIQRSTSMGIVWIFGFVLVLGGSAGLRMEMSRREQAEMDLLRHKESLEDQVKERTADLNKLNDELKKEIVERQKESVLNLVETKV
ncbi:MAG: DUF3365 domain-containing protein [Nitrospinae bacterium]|nr:DUF3365 domain-containing protein [Nitrospinota bacterium]